jgi:hypothetical protein
MVVVGCNAIAVTSHTQLKFVETEKSWLAEGRGPDFVLLARVGSALTALRMETPEINQRDTAAASPSITRVRDE